MAQCGSAESIVGPLRDASLSDVDRIDDDITRRRARHVVTENLRVGEFIDALARREFTDAGRVMTAGHRSLSEDFATSTPVMDAAVQELLATPGVLGARMTGGGFGGCVVAMCDAGADVAGWKVTPVGAAALETV